MLTFILISTALGLAACVVQSPSAANTLTSFSLVAGSLSLLLVPVYAVRFGYFPSTSKGKGVARLDDPLQFWATTAAFALAAVAVLFVAVGLQIGSV